MNVPNAQGPQPVLAPSIWAGKGTAAAVEGEGAPSEAHRRPNSPSKAPPVAQAAPVTPLASGPTVSYPLLRELDLANTNVLLTGGTNGLGLEAAKMLCAKNARLFLVGADYEKGQEALRAVQGAVPKARIDFFQCDIASLKSVHIFAAAFKSLGVPLHVLVCNAGSFLWPYRKTPEGFELSVASNYLGHFLLAHLLLPELQAATPSRIIWQSSAFEQLGRLQWQDLGGEFARDSDLFQYANSKLYNIMAAREMAKRLKGTGVDVFAVHPGLVDTPLFNRTSPEKPASWLFTAAARVLGQSATRGAYSTVYAAGAPELDGKGGAYIGPPYLGLLSTNVLNTSCLIPLNPQAHSAENSRRLYEETAWLLEEKTGQPLPNKLPAAYREHPWQERAAGWDRAHPVDATLEASPPPYHAHAAVAHAKQALRGIASSGAPAVVDS